jgi:hypothetical protein
VLSIRLSWREVQNLDRAVLFNFVTEISKWNAARPAIDKMDDRKAGLDTCCFTSLKMRFSDSVSFAIFGLYLSNHIVESDFQILFQTANGYAQEAAGLNLGQ